MTSQRTTLHHLGSIRAWYAARADHREEPALPKLRRPAMALFLGKRTYKLRSYRKINRAQKRRSLLLQRGRRRRQRKRRGA